MKGEVPKPVIIGVAVLVVAALVLVGFLLNRGQAGGPPGGVIHPKPWSGPGSMAHPGSPAQGQNQAAH